MDASRAPAAGWYPDPAGSRLLRWWDGQAWTDHLLDPTNPPASAAPDPVYVPMRSAPTYQPTEPSLENVSTSTRAIWIMALYPFFSYALTWAVIAITNTPNPTLLGVISLTTLVLEVATAFRDHSVLQSRGLRAASAWWILLSPIAYLIARRIRLKKLGIIANAPGNVYALSLVAGVALAFVVAPPIIARSADTASIASLQTQAALDLEHQTSTGWTVTCPQDAPVETVAAVFTCHATDTTGHAVDIQATVVFARQFTIKLEPANGSGTTTTT
ncbi:MAG: hypothetical protein JWN80_1611 [Microbacteriaceae bacterium]|nr:hypothetical protein [Microbacteriaceae bacterium]